MHYNVPQFIDIEDKIVGPLTAKQLLWMFGMGGVLLIMWFMIDNKGTFFLFGIPVALLFVALAFYRPYGQPLSKFIASAFLFIVRPKIYLWKREAETKRQSSLNNLTIGAKQDNLVRTIDKKNIKKDDLQRLARVLDSEAKILEEDNYLNK